MRFDCRQTANRQLSIANCQLETVTTNGKLVTGNRRQATGDSRHTDRPTDNRQLSRQKFVPGTLQKPSMQKSGRGIPQASIEVEDSPRLIY